MSGLFSCKFILPKKLTAEAGTFQFCPRWKFAAGVYRRFRGLSEANINQRYRIASGHSFWLSAYLKGLSVKGSGK